jgi:hypothetical protein
VEVNSTHSSPQYETGVSGQLHAPAILPPEMSSVAIETRCLWEFKILPYVRTSGLLKILCRDHRNSMQEGM